MESEDWIFNFNIGNVMHLQALEFDEFSKTKSKISNELDKDVLLYKIIYVIVAYFCIGTELRFLATMEPDTYNPKDSEMWHAKTIHIASYFLPNDCPII